MAADAGAAGYGGAGLHPLSSLQEELQCVLPEGTRLIDSGAAIARRTAWLLEHEAPDAKSSDENKAFCMALTAETEQLLPVLRRYGFSTLENYRSRAFCTKRDG